MAAQLREFAGLKAGERVILHLLTVPVLPIAMVACARLGVVRSVVFGDFNAESRGDRVAASGSRVQVTMDGYYGARKLLEDQEVIGSACVDLPDSAEAGVVPSGDAIKGRVAVVYVCLQPDSKQAPRFPPRL